MSRLVDSTDEDHIFRIFEMVLFSDIACIVQYDSFFHSWSICGVLFQDNHHIIEGMNLTPTIHIVADILFQILSS